MEFPGSLNRWDRWFSCELGEAIYHRSHLLREPETAMDILGESQTIEIYMVILGWFLPITHDGSMGLAGIFTYMKTINIIHPWSGKYTIVSWMLWDRKYMQGGRLEVKTCICSKQKSHEISSYQSSFWHSDGSQKKNITSAMPIPVAAFLKLLLCLTSAPSVLAKHRSHNCWPQPAAFATLNNSDKLSEKNDSFKHVSLVLVSLLSIWRDSYFTTVKTGSVSNGKHLCQKYRVLKFMHE